MKKDINQMFVYPKTWITAETKEIAASIRQLTNKEVIANRLEYQDTKNYDKQCAAVRKKLAFEVGCQGLMLPENVGGGGLNRLADTPTLIAILKEIGRADASIGFIHALEYAVSSLFAMEPNVNKSLCKQWAGLFCKKELNSVSLILPGPGDIGLDDPLFEGRSIKAKVSTAGGNVTVTGKNLRPIGCGAQGAVFCVVCVDESGKPCVALVPGDAQGITRHGTFKKTGLDGCGNADIDFEMVTIPEDHLITRESAPYELYTWLNLLLAGVSIGTCMGSLEILIAWTEKRVIKGTSLLKDNPLCAAVLAEVYEEIAVAWMLTQDLANNLVNPKEWGDSGSPLIFSVSQMLGRRIQEGCIKAINKTMELMASEGYAKEGSVEKTWRDVKTIQSCLCGLGGEAPARLDVARCIFESRHI